MLHPLCPPLALLLLLILLLPFSVSSTSTTSSPPLTLDGRLRGYRCGRGQGRHGVMVSMALVTKAMDAYVAVVACMVVGVINFVLVTNAVDAVLVVAVAMVF